MIQPTKLMNLDLCTLRIASLIIQILKKQRMMGYEDLVEKLSKILEEDAHPFFLLSVEFLYLLGKVEYYPKTDSFELLHSP